MENIIMRNGNEQKYIRKLPKSRGCFMREKTNLKAIQLLPSGKIVELGKYQSFFQTKKSIELWTMEGMSRRLKTFSRKNIGFCWEK